MMAGRVKVSIVTPSFNQGRYIRDCIESVAALRGAEIEHIVVDNCSTDDTLDALKSFPQLRWISEPDRGQSDALNKGFRMATGEWIGWLNADEYYEADALGRIVHEISRSPVVDVIYGDTRLVDESRRQLRMKRAYPFDRGMLLYWGCYMNTCSTFWRRRFVDEGLMLDESFHYHMDHEFLVRLAFAGYRFEHVRGVLGNFRVHDEGKTSNERTLPKRLADRARIQQKYGARFSENETLNRACYTGLERYYAVRTLVPRALQKAGF